MSAKYLVVTVPISSFLFRELEISEPRKSAARKQRGWNLKPFASRAFALFRPPSHSTNAAPERTHTHTAHTQPRLKAQETTSGRESGIWPQPHIPTWLRQAQGRLWTPAPAGVRAGAVTPAAPLTRYGSPEGPRSSSPGGWRAAGAPEPLRHSTSPSSCPTANPSERNEASGMPLSWPRACATPADVDLKPSWFGWRRIGVLKSSLAERHRH